MSTPTAAYCHQFDNNCGQCLQSQTANTAACSFCPSIGCVANITAQCPGGKVSKSGSCPLPTDQFHVSGIYIFAAICFALSLLSMIVQIVLRHPRFVMSTLKARRIVPVVTRFFVVLFSVVFTGIATHKGDDQYTLPYGAVGDGTLSLSLAAPTGLWVCGVNTNNWQSFSSKVPTAYSISPFIINLAMFVFAVICFIGWFTESLLILRGSKMANFATGLFLVLIIAIQPAMGIQGAVPLNSDPPCLIGASIGFSHTLVLLQVIPLFICLIVPLILLAAEPVAPEWIRKKMPEFLKTVAPKPAIAALEEEGSHAKGMIKLPKHYTWQNYIVGSYFSAFVFSIVWGLGLCFLNFFSGLFDGSIWGQIHRIFFTSLFPVFDVLFVLAGKLIHHILYVNVYTKGRWGTDASLVAEQEILMSNEEVNLLGGAEDRLQTFGAGLKDKYDEKKGNSKKEKEGGLTSSSSESGGYGATGESSSSTHSPKEGGNNNNNNDDDDNNDDAFGTTTSKARLSTARPRSSVAFAQIAAAEEKETSSNRLQDNNNKNVSSKSKKSDASSITIFEAPNQDALTADDGASSKAGTHSQRSLRQSAAVGEEVEAFPEAESHKRPVSSRFFISELEDQQWEEVAKAENDKILTSDANIYRPPSFFMALATLLFLLISNMLDIWAATGNPAAVGTIATMPSPEEFAQFIPCITLVETFTSFIDGAHKKSACWQLAAIGPLMICLYVFVSLWLIVSIYAYIVNNKRGDIAHLVVLGISAFCSIFLLTIVAVQPPAKCLLKDFSNLGGCPFTEPDWQRGPAVGPAFLFTACIVFSFSYFLSKFFDPIRIPKPVVPPGDFIAKYGFWTQYVEPVANRKNRVFFITKPLFLTVQYMALVNAISRFIKVVSQNWLTLLAFWTPAAQYEYSATVINQIVLDGRRLELHIEMADFCFVWFREAFLNLITGSLWSRFSTFSVEKWYDSQIRFVSPPHCKGLFRYFDIPTTQNLSQIFYTMGHVVKQRPSSLSEFQLRLTEMEMEFIWYGDMQCRLVPGAMQVLKVNHPIATIDPQGAHLDTQLEIVTCEHCALCGIGEYECKCSCDMHTPLCLECAKEHQKKAVATLRRQLKSAEKSWLFKQINKNIDPNEFHRICKIIPSAEDCESDEERKALQKAWLSLKGSMKEAAAKTLPESALKRIGVDKEQMQKEKHEKERIAKEKAEEEERNRVVPLCELTGDEKYRAEKRFALFYKSHSVKGSATKALSSDLGEEEFMQRLCKKHKVFEEDELEAANAENLLPKAVAEKLKQSTSAAEQQDPSSTANAAAAESAPENKPSAAAAAAESSSSTKEKSKVSFTSEAVEEEKPKTEAVVASAAAKPVVEEKKTIEEKVEEEEKKIEEEEKKKEVEEEKQEEAEEKKVEEEEKKKEVEEEKQEEAEEKKQDEAEETNTSQAEGQEEKKEIETSDEQKEDPEPASAASENNSDEQSTDGSES